MDFQLNSSVTTKVVEFHSSYIGRNTPIIHCILDGTELSLLIYKNKTRVATYSMFPFTDTFLEDFTKLIAKMMTERIFQKCVIFETNIVFTLFNLDVEKFKQLGNELFENGIVHLCPKSIKIRKTDSELKQQIIEDTYNELKINGFVSQSKLYRIVREKYFWKYMKKEIYTFVKETVIQNSNDDATHFPTNTDCHFELTK